MVTVSSSVRISPLELQPGLLVLEFIVRRLNGQAAQFLDAHGDRVSIERCGLKTPEWNVAQQLLPFFGAAGSAVFGAAFERKVRNAAFAIDLQQDWKIVYRPQLR